MRDVLNQDVVSQGKLLDEHAAGVYLGGIPFRTLRQWRYLGQGPPYLKVGHRVRYRTVDLDAWLADNRVNPQRV
jgi:hypothetical protein